MTREEYYEEYGEYPAFTAGQLPNDSNNLHTDLLPAIVTLLIIILFFEAIRRSFYYIFLGTVFPKK